MGRPLEDMADKRLSDASFCRLSRAHDLDDRMVQHFYKYPVTRWNLFLFQIGRSLLDSPARN